MNHPTCQFPVYRCLPPDRGVMAACGAEAEYEAYVPYMEGRTFCHTHRMALDKAGFDIRGLKEIPSAAGHFARLANQVREALESSIEACLYPSTHDGKQRLSDLIDLVGDLSNHLEELDEAVRAAEVWLASQETEASACPET